MSATPISADPAAEIVHQTLVRELNERIRTVNAGYGVEEPDLIDVVCECARPGCTGRLTMTVADYELVRRFPTRFFVKAGHEIGDGERVVSESSGHVVVEASGGGGLYAVAADPRRSRNGRRVVAGA
jgi:hypothetical protein